MVVCNVICNVHMHRNICGPIIADNWKGANTFSDHSIYTVGNEGHL